MLTDREGFAVALHRLGAFHSKALDAATVDDYWRLLQPELDDQQFRQACAALAAGDWWPTPARVLRAARFAAPFAWRSAIGRLYSAVRACDEFGPTGGTTYRAERVRQQCGDLGARLFSAVGGPAAFMRAFCEPEAETFLRKAFMEAARELTAEEPEAITALVDGTMPAALPRSHDAVPLPIVRALSDSLRLDR